MKKAALYNEIATGLRSNNDESGATLLASRMRNVSQFEANLELYSTVESVIAGVGELFAAKGIEKVSSVLAAGSAVLKTQASFDNQAMTGMILHTQQINTESRNRLPKDSMGLFATSKSVITALVGSKPPVQAAKNSTKAKILPLIT